MSDDTSRQLPLVCILRQGRYLIATIHAALDDGQLTRFQHNLVEQIGREHSDGVVTAADLDDGLALLDELTV